MVDYSKWDKLELSDDSDVEVHPNVDKNSFIRWKQRDIHEKRERNRLRTAQLEVNIETNEDLLRRVQKLAAAAASGANLNDVEGALALANQGETKDKPSKATSPEQPKYSDMIESLLMQVTQEVSGSENVAAKLNEHKEMILNALKEENKELAELKEERLKYLTSDDLREGWNSTIVNKPSDVKSTGATGSNSGAGASSSGTSTKTEIEVLNPGAGAGGAGAAKPKKNEDGLEELLPATKAFGELPKGDFDATFKFLSQHPEIVTEGQKDALIMSAFDVQLAGDSKGAERVVYNALLLQYSSILGKDGVRVFYSRIINAGHPARKAFEDDVATTYNHIKSRCEILKQESQVDEEPVEQIQLHAVDPNTEIVIAVPEKDSPGRELFDKFPAAVQKAVENRSLEQINKVLADMPIEDAENLVGELGEAGVLLVEEKIYDAGEWEEKRKAEGGDTAEKRTADQADETAEPPSRVVELPEDDGVVPSTVDDVD